MHVHCIKVPPQPWAALACPSGGRLLPPGINRYTPAQAAAALARTFVLSPIEIGMAPELKVHSDDPAGTAPYRRTWVGIPVWLWVNNPTPSSWGGRSPRLRRSAGGSR